MCNVQAWLSPRLMTIRRRGTDLFVYRRINHLAVQRITSLAQSIIMFKGELDSGGMSYGLFSRGEGRMDDVDLSGMYCLLHSISKL